MVGFWFHPQVFRTKPPTPAPLNTATLYMGDFLASSFLSALRLMQSSCKTSQWVHYYFNNPFFTLFVLTFQCEKSWKSFHFIKVTEVIRDSLRAVLLRETPYIYYKIKLLKSYC